MLRVLGITVHRQETSSRPSHIPRLAQEAPAQQTVQAVSHILAVMHHAMAFAGMHAHTDRCPAATLQGLCSDCLNLGNNFNMRHVVPLSRSCQSLFQDEAEEIQTCLHATPQNRKRKGKLQHGSALSRYREPSRDERQRRTQNGQQCSSLLT